jgi:dimethylglycine dehydrogenase
LLSMRLEKNFPTWYRELRPIYGPFEAAMERFVDLSKAAFIGREAAIQEKETGGTLRRVSLVIEASDADALGDEPIWHEGKVIGWVTSGGYGHFVDRSLAQGYVPRMLSSTTAPRAFEVEILGERRAATIINEPPFDPGGSRMRM